MPSTIRQTATTAVNLIRGLRTDLADRRCHHLLLLNSVAEIVRTSELLDGRVVRLDPDLSSDVSQRVRATIASLGDLELRGDAFALGGMRDGVGRLITERQIPILYLVHLLAAVIGGAESGMRDLVSGRPAPADAVTTSEQVDPRETSHPSTSIGSAPMLASPTPDAALDLLGRAMTAPATASGPKGGRLSIKQDTERI